ncbi:hypothetical protein Glove_95g39 [Diversispora epigaea]|uniref:C2H2-type domain-containing protein n=1 Tax=Diversispora epigaea TaxID=1348612 RepID=A0A397JFG9_9GLOM|nr:hypothetical protein Glove_95g39 [Diversispora epigaea]
MSTSFQCPHCPRNFSTRNAYSQHVNRCINTVYLSTEESSEDISDIVSSVNEMSLDDEDFSRINEFQIIREENSQVFYQYESDQDYAGDISFGEISHLSNILKEYENFDEILSASLQSNEEPVSHSSNIPEEYENFDEILPASLQSNEEPEVENIKEFPNEAYADLMALVIENNLNNKAGNAIIKFFNKHLNLSQLSPLPKNIETGRKFMNKMNISQLSYSKYCVLTHNSQDYFVHYRPIKNCIKNLLSNPDILKNLMFRYENSKIEDEKSYGEQNSGNWWKRAERSISNYANILSIILYSDATTTDTLGKSSLHPIYVSLGNIPTWRRNKEDAKQLLGYLPILSAKNEKEKKSSEFKELARETFHNSIKFLLDPLFQGDGVDFNIYDKDIWFFPRISTIICDWPEACTFSLTYKSANSNYPCHFCLVQREDLIDIRKEVILRNHVNMKEYFDSNTSNLAEPEVENIKEFPNEAYADLMALVIENNLNNKAGNAIIKFFNKHLNLSQLSPLPKNIETGRKFMDKMNISQLSYSKYCVLTHNSQDYFVHYRPIKNCIKNLLSNPDILKNLMFRYENSKIEDEKSYGEQNSGNWWKRAERSISNYANILSIILYSDATTTDTLGKSSLHPIYVSLGNIPTWRRNKEDAKQLIADIPRHSQLKVFKKGIQLSRLTASEYRDMMKIMVFVVDDLQIENLSEVYVKWNEMYLLSRSEKFKESDLENFQKTINNWGDLFIKLFQKISNSHLKFLKLHSWIYHIVDTIREYGAINGYTTETYESLHKTYVKIPYRLSNKKEVEKQIMENIRRRAIVSRNRVGKTKTPMAFVYIAKLFDFDLSESMIDSVTLKNGAILHTKNDFHHRPWFSNIAVNMNEEELSEYLSDKGICYAQTLLITEIRLPNKSPMHLALVQWYDFIEETPFVYGCPLLRLVEVYNFIEIETIEDTIHVVLRFDKNNEYFSSSILHSNLSQPHPQDPAAKLNTGYLKNKASIR